MRRTLIAIAAAAAMAAGTLAAPQPAKADISAWWLVPAFVAGVWVGHAHAYPYPFWGPRCWYENRKIKGVWRSVRVCR
jgi:hypothetical protein